MNINTNEELYKVSVVDIYKMVLKGNILRKFPRGFWQRPESQENAAKCTKYLIEEILKYDEEALKKQNLTTLFTKNKLGGMLKICFDNSPYNAINNAYPNKYKEWELRYTPANYWNNKENAIKATKWLIEEKLKLSDEELKKQLSAKLFIDNGLRGMLYICFNNSPFKAINSAYPNKYKEWEFNQVPNRYWNKENGIKITKWLIEEKLKLSDEELKMKLSTKFFSDNKLDTMLKYCFNSSPYEAINTTYPNKFKKYDFKAYKK